MLRLGSSLSCVVARSLSRRQLSSSSHAATKINSIASPTSTSSTILAANFINRLTTDLEKLRITATPILQINRKEIRDFPITPISIENPRDTLINEIRDILNENHRRKVIEIPATSKNTEIQAARLIVIRRRKMKKHKLRKLRKKMKFEWAKVRQRREMRKEKRFQAGLLHRIKLAEAFSAEQYVSEKLRLANEIPIPRYWKGRRLPQFIIKEKMGIK